MFLFLRVQLLLGEHTMKSTFRVLWVLLVLAIGASAQESTISPKNNPDPSPLANRTAGIEFSPVRLLWGYADPGSFGAKTQVSGTLSLFAIDRHAEIAFPFLLAIGTNENIPLRVLNVDATYRRFLSEYQGGFYLSGGIRYGFASGVELIDRRPTGKKTEHTKVGAYAGIGYRYFTHSGLYWGTNIVIGRFFGDFSYRSGEADLDDGPFLIDCELLKIGFAF